jgi:phosphoesterase RecJ-like protein
MSSCGEMLYHLYRKLKIPIDQKAAMPMYVAIVTDTGYFSYENTTYKTHKTSSELIRRGIKPLLVSKQLNERKSLNDLKLLNKTLATLRLYYGGRLAMLHTSKDTLKKLSLGPESAEGLVNYARSVDSVKLAAFFIERPDKPGEVHISFRSKGEVDVNKFAQLFGGGGHPNAAGCLIKGSIAQAKKIVLNKVKTIFYGRDTNSR